MLRTSCIGFCRNNKSHDLVNAVSDYLAKEIDDSELLGICKKIRFDNWKVQKEHGIDIIPSNDFSMYDHVLDTTCLLGNIQRRFYWEGGRVPMNIYFSMVQGQQHDKFDVLPLELQNWLNTNYLYYVPEFVDPIDFAYSDNKPIIEYLEAKMIGIETTSTIMGPISYLLSGKSKEPDIEPLDLLDDVLAVYKELFINYQRIGVKNVQIEEPLIGIDLDRSLQNKFTYCYNALRQYAGDINLHFVSYYSNLRDSFELICSLPVNSFHIDVPNNADIIDNLLERLPNDKAVSLGLIDARNVWKNDLQQSIEIASKFCDKVGSENVIASTSGPLFLCPYSVELETLPEELKGKLSFAIEKLDELAIIKKAINSGVNSVKEELKANAQAIKGSMALAKTTITLRKEPAEKEVKTTKKTQKNDRWNSFIKARKIKAPASMLFGEFSTSDDVRYDDSIAIQEKAGLDVISGAFLKKNYDISAFTENTVGAFVLKNNPIQRFGHDFFNPTIIYKVPTVQGKNFKKYVDAVRKKTKQPLKIAIPSPLSFVNSAFVNPYLDTEIVKQKIGDDMIGIVNENAAKIDILQINDTTLTTNLLLKPSKMVQQVKNICREFNHFIAKLKDIKCIAFYSGYVYLNEIIEELCRLRIDMLLIESARSGHEVLDAFVSYKPQIIIGFGLFDPLDRRTPTRQEILSAGKKILMCFDASQIIVSADGDFYLKQNEDIVSKSLNILVNVNKELHTIAENDSKK